jgi:hypothetical protein
MGTLNGGSLLNFNRVPDTPTISKNRTSSPMFGSKKVEFVRVFQEFADAFVSTPEGQKHISLYDENRQTGRPQLSGDSSSRSPW